MISFVAGDDQTTADPRELSLEDHISHQPKVKQPKLVETF